MGLFSQQAAVYSHVYPVSGEITDREKTRKWGLALGHQFLRL